MQPRLLARMWFITPGPNQVSSFEVWKSTRARILGEVNIKSRTNLSQNLSISSSCVRSRFVVLAAAKKTLGPWGLSHWPFVFNTTTHFQPKVPEWGLGFWLETNSGGGQTSNFQNMAPNQKTGSAPTFRLNCHVFLPPPHSLLVEPEIDRSPRSWTLQNWTSAKHKRSINHCVNLLSFPKLWWGSRDLFLIWSLSFHHV